MYRLHFVCIVDTIRSSFLRNPKPRPKPRIKATLPTTKTIIAQVGKPRTAKEDGEVLGEIGFKVGTGRKVLGEIRLEAGTGRSLFGKIGLEAGEVFGKGRKGRGERGDGPVQANMACG